jgi:hypothetical protein
LLDRLALQLSQISFGSSDGASTMVKFWRDLKIPSALCVAHFLHNVLVKSFEEKLTKALFEKLKAFASLLHRSSKKTALFEAIQLGEYDPQAQVDQKHSSQANDDDDDDDDDDDENEAESKADEEAEQKIDREDLVRAASLQKLPKALAIPRYVENRWTSFFRV